MRAGSLCTHESAPDTWYWASLKSITTGAAHPVVSPGAGYPEPLCPFPTDIARQRQTSPYLRRIS